MRKMLLAAVALAIAAPANAMDVATYLAKAQHLQALGMAAVFSSDYREMTAEGTAAVHALRQERLAALVTRTPDLQDVRQKLNDVFVAGAGLVDRAAALEVAVEQGAGEVAVVHVLGVDRWLRPPS